MSDSLLELVLTHKASEACRKEIEAILRRRIQMRDENIRQALEHLKSGEYEKARITLETFA